MVMQARASSALRVEHYVFDALPLPGVGDMDAAVAALYDGRVRELHLGLFLQYEPGLPVESVFRNSDVQRGAAAAPLQGVLSDMVVDNQLSAIMEGDGVGA